MAHGLSIPSSTLGCQALQLVTPHLPWSVPCITTHEPKLALPQQPPPLTADTFMTNCLQPVSMTQEQQQAGSIHAGQYQQGTPAKVTQGMGPDTTL